MSTTEMAAGVAERAGLGPDCLTEYPGFREAVSALQQGGRATFDGVWGVLLRRRWPPCPSRSPRCRWSFFVSVLPMSMA